ncbi:MAG TPA: beta-ketoacyl-[acyl-carrier-protein] synthase family protein [Burkholderiales bacterium]|nr:beta-ketoacyl-[acyl-carrier-protein] synthase family protein [Burkholderiales bacterium]
MSCYLQAVGIVSSLGEGLEATRRALFAGDTSGMRVESGWLPNAPACVGRVTGELAPLPSPLEEHDCRNNRLLAAAATQIRPAIDAALARHGAQRVAIVIGTSTSGIASGEDAMAAKIKDGAFPRGFSYKQQEIGATAPLAARLLGVRGPAYTVSTACTSGAKALLAARRLLDLGLCDAAIAGGVDTLCRLTVGGFAALESTSPQRCNPLSRNRSGINIGEGAALFLLSRDEAAVELAGGGESSDAHHLSAPDPQGAGAETAMRAALADAGAQAADIGYINLHATATRKNDEMESRVMARVFPQGTPVSGTKPLTGHALGAAGAIEAAFCWLALTDGRLPPHVWDGERDPELPALRVVAQGERLSSRLVMSNSFAFGGSNASLIFSGGR